MDKKVTPEEAGDWDTVSAHLLSADELRVYTDGPPEDDRTTIIQDSFVKLHGDPDLWRISGGGMEAEGEYTLDE